MDVSSYLNRINYHGPGDVSAETLRELHKAHLLAVPFENLDVHLGRTIVLDEQKLVSKIVVERRESELWKPQYRFTLDAHKLDDFGEMCRYHQTSPESPFTQKRVCTLATPGGRITVSGMRLIVNDRGEKQERELASHDEWTA